MKPKTIAHLQNGGKREGLGLSKLKREGRGGGGGGDKGGRGVFRVNLS